MKTAIIVDSTAGLPNEKRNHEDIFVVDLHLHFADGTVLRDTSDEEEAKTFYERLQHEKELPTTSQPTLGAYYEVMDEVVAQGYDTVYAIHLASVLSGTYSTAHIVTEEYRDRLDIYCIDSKAIGVVVEKMVDYLLSALDNEVPLDEINTNLKWFIDESELYVLVDQLNNLSKSGRLSPAQAMMGSLLRVKPLLKLAPDGRLEVAEKIRSNKRAYNRLVEIAVEAQNEYADGVEIHFMHADTIDVINQLKEQIQEQVPSMNFRVRGLGPIVGTHVGKGAFAMAIIPNLPQK